MDTKEPLILGGVFEVECYGPNGKLKWRDVAVTNPKRRPEPPPRRRVFRNDAGAFLRLVRGPRGIFTDSGSRRHNGVTQRLDRDCCLLAGEPSRMGTGSRRKPAGRKCERGRVLNQRHGHGRRRLHRDQQHYFGNDRDAFLRGRVQPGE